MGIKDLDVTYVLLRRFLGREGFFDRLEIDQSHIFDGLMGRLQYNAPPREYQFRLDRLNNFREKIGFPRDFHLFKEKLLEIDRSVRKFVDEDKVNFDTFAKEWKRILALDHIRGDGGDQYT